MKRKLWWALGAIVLLFVLIQFIPVNRTNPPVTQEIVWNAPETKALAQRACYDCHSNETTWPWESYVAPISWFIGNHIAEGRERLNFSEWDKPNGEAEEIIRSVRNGSMPLQSYLIMHPDAKLTAAEKEALIAGLNATLQADPPFRGAANVVSLVLVAKRGSVSRKAAKSAKVSRVFLGELRALA